MKLLAFAASHRKESFNAKLLTLAVGHAKTLGVEVATLHYSVLDAPLFDADNYQQISHPATIQHFVEQLHHVDGLIIASPEYNWSFPGSLKNIIDWLSVCSPNPLAGKTALLVSASPSLRGGLQGLIQLRVPLDHLGMFVFPQFFALGRAEDAFDATGHFVDEKLAKEYTELVEDFVQMTEKMTHA